MRRRTRSRITPSKVHAELGKHMLVSGSPVVVDLEKSAGCRLLDASSGKTYLDFFMFFASSPLGFNHPRLFTEDVLRELQAASINNPANSYFYTVSMAKFLEAADRYAVPKELPNVFLISGGALAVENALKAAFDWKVRKNFQRGVKREVGTKVIHFRQAFHGRTGYTMSLTNTNPAKTDHFPKFAWPRITNPKIEFPLSEHMESVIAAEEKAKREIKDAIKKSGNDIAALIIEPIQGEGGDNHFRPEFMRFLRQITDENEILFILDEVQTGVGMTGKFWAYEHTGMIPDIIAFGKKLQVCGIMASQKINEVDSVFKVPGRINSTWGGNLADMVRAVSYLEIIAEEDLVDNARDVGDYFLNCLEDLAGEYQDLVSNVRGKGLFTAFDLPDASKRDDFVKRVFANGMIIGACGGRSIRFRPPLNVKRTEIDEGVGIIGRSLGQVMG
jgi:L-lysine 6-transaminase